MMIRVKSSKNSIILMLLMAVITNVTACGSSSSGNSLTPNGNAMDGADTVKPVIRLKGKATINLLKGADYQDAGAVATDNVDGNITSKIITTGKVNTQVIGTYKKHFNVKDKVGNSAEEVIRLIHVTNANSAEPKISTITFKSVPIAKNDHEKSVMRISPKLTVVFDNGKIVKESLIKSHKIL